MGAAQVAPSREEVPSGDYLSGELSIGHCPSETQTLSLIRQVAQLVLPQLALEDALWMETLKDFKESHEHVKAFPSLEYVVGERNLNVAEHDPKLITWTLQCTDCDKTCSEFIDEVCRTHGNAHVCEQVRRHFNMRKMRTKREPSVRSDV